MIGFPKKSISNELELLKSKATKDVITITQVSIKIEVTKPHYSIKKNSLLIVTVVGSNIIKVLFPQLLFLTMGSDKLSESDRVSPRSGIFVSRSSFGVTLPSRDTSTDQLTNKMQLFTETQTVRGQQRRLYWFLFPFSLRFCAAFTLEAPDDARS